MLVAIGYALFYNFEKNVSKEMITKRRFCCVAKQAYFFIKKMHGDYEYVNTWRTVHDIRS